MRSAAPSSQEAYDAGKIGAGVSLRSVKRIKLRRLRAERRRCAGGLRRFNTGDPPELKQYLLVVTPRAQEREHLSPLAFQRTLEEALRAVGKPIEGDFTKVLEERPPGEPALIAELLRDPDAASVVRAMRVPPPQGLFSFLKPSQYVLSSTSLILLRGKALTLSVTSGYESKADVDWIRSVTLRWIEELRRLNLSR